MIINPPSIAPKLATKKKVRGSNNGQKYQKIEDFTEDKLPKIEVIMVHDRFESLGV